MARWLSALALVGFVALGVRSAGAQVFKPRTGGKAGPVARTAPPAAAKKSPAATPVAAAPSRKPTRAAGPTPRRVVTTSPAKKPARGKSRKDGVEVRDDDDDVKITDD
ncbi:MAG TPA: hypothetical protein VFT22_12190 [Kofleriaceae bacterium]|nr:hypothetical protein [Kofleriaceae bacterium]